MYVLKILGQKRSLGVQGLLYRMSRTSDRLEDPSSAFQTSALFDAAFLYTKEPMAVLGV